jgi:hypothetical protein
MTGSCPEESNPFLRFHSKTLAALPDPVYSRETTSDSPVEVEVVLAGTISQSVEVSIGSSDIIIYLIVVFLGSNFFCKT